MHCVLVKSLHKSFPLWIILITRLVVWITEGLFSLKEKCLHFQTVSSKASNFPWTACRDPERQRKGDHMSSDSNIRHNPVWICCGSEKNHVLKIWTQTLYSSNIWLSLKSWFCFREKTNKQGNTAFDAAGPSEGGRLELEYSSSCCWIMKGRAS